MRRTITPAIPASMYRHFVVVTIVLTAALALFAEGENREMLASETARPAPAEPAPPKLVAPSRSSPSPGRSAPSVFNHNFGQPTNQLFTDGSSSIVPGEALEIGYSSEYLASLSVEERELLLQGLRESGMLEPGIRRQRSTALAAASRRRSGAPAGAD